MWFVAACAVPAACTLNPQTDTPSLTGTKNDKGGPGHQADAGVVGPGAGNSTGSGGARGSGGFAPGSGGFIGGAAGTSDNKGGAGNRSSDAGAGPLRDASTTTDSGAGEAATDASDAAKTMSDGGALKGP